jgi:hypothetical protein
MLLGGFSRGQEFASGAVGKRLGPHCRKHLVCGSQLLSRFSPPALAPQPLAVD